MTIAIILLIIYIMGRSIRQFLLFKEVRFGTYKTSLSLEIIYTFITIYFIFIIGFGLIYYTLSYKQQILIYNVQDLDLSEGFLGHLFISLYFSGVTLLTIGYGDITPLGIGKMIAIIQALFGYILPTAFILKLVQLNKTTLK